MYAHASTWACETRPLQVVDPSQESTVALGIVAVLVLLGLSAFFASSEIAIFSLSDVRIGALAEDGVAEARTLERLKSNPRKLLVTILAGNNVANIGMSSITTGLLALYLEPGESVLVATFGITSLVLLFGESAPKAYAVEHSEPWALRIAGPLRLAQFLLFPLVAVFDVLTRSVNRLMGSEGDFERAYVTRAHIREVIEAGGRAGVLADEEHRMLQRLLRFRNRTAREAMVPRPDVVAVPATADVETAIQTCIDSGFVRLPVYEDDLDTVVGVADLRDLVAARGRSDELVRGVARKPYVVPETKGVDGLLRELRSGRERLAIVVDEFGATAGIVTVEDIAEEIVGEILTESEAAPIRWLEDGAALVRGELNVHALNEALGTALPEPDEVESVAGLVLDHVGRVVEEGEAVTYGDVRLVVETVDHNRILEVRVELPGEAGEPLASSEGE